MITEMDILRIKFIRDRSTISLAEAKDKLEIVKEAEKLSADEVAKEFGRELCDGEWMREDFVNYVVSVIPRHDWKNLADAINTFKNCIKQLDSIKQGEK